MSIDAAAITAIAVGIIMTLSISLLLFHPASHTSFVK